MIGKMSQNAPVPGGTVLLIGFLTAMIALAAPTESRGAGQPSENGGFGGYLGTSGPPLFMPTVPYDSGGYTGKSIAVADLNGDGKLDLVIGNECASSGCTDGASVGVLLGNGDGTFQTAVAYRTGALRARFSQSQ
jgi:FG-GAP repeat